ncbi:MAG TPA: MaoC family dehydratase [Gaiellaceae bacterium]
MTTTLKLSELEGTGELELGTSDWVEITQDQVNQFAEATGDHQWIHVDPERAKQGPFGRTIAHGYLTLSLLPQLMPQVMRIEDAVMGVNYGVEKIRFTNPVPVGSRVRLHAKLLGSDAKGGGRLNRVGVQMEIEGDEKPAMVGEVLFLVFGAPDA